MVSTRPPSQKGAKLAEITRLVTKVKSSLKGEDKQARTTPRNRDQLNTGPQAGDHVRVWWPPTKDKTRTEFSGAYWPALVKDRKTVNYAIVQYDNEDEEKVHIEHLQPFDPPVAFGAEKAPLQVGEFCEVSNNSSNDPCAWFGKVAKRLRDGSYQVEYPFHDTPSETIKSNLIRRARVFERGCWRLVEPNQTWKDGEVSSPLELRLVQEEDLAQRPPAANMDNTAPGVSASAAAPNQANSAATPPKDAMAPAATVTPVAATSTQKKRGRPPGSKNKAKEEGSPVPVQLANVQPPAAASPSAADVQKKRGRPLGSKNKPRIDPALPNTAALPVLPQNTLGTAMLPVISQAPLPTYKYAVPAGSTAKLDLRSLKPGDVVTVHGKQYYYVPEAQLAEHLAATGGLPLGGISLPAGVTTVEIPPPAAPQAPAPPAASANAAVPATLPEKRKKDPLAPKQPHQAYWFFAEAKRGEATSQWVAEHPESATDGAKTNQEVNRLLGDMWRALSTEEKQKYEELAAQDKVRYERDMATYVPPPAETDQAIKRKRKEGPPKPHTAYICFSMDFRKSLDMKAHSFSEATEKTAAAWKALDEEGRKKYEAMAAQDKERYQEELEKWKALKASTAATAPAAVQPASAAPVAPAPLPPPPPVIPPVAIPLSLPGISLVPPNPASLPLVLPLPASAAVAFMRAPTPPVASAPAAGGFPPAEIDRVLAEGLDLKKAKKKLQDLGYSSEAYMLLVDVWRPDSPKLPDALRSYKVHVQGHPRPDYQMFMIGIFGLDRMNSLKKPAGDRNGAE